MKHFKKLSNPQKNKLIIISLIILSILLPFLGKGLFSNSSSVYATLFEINILIIFLGGVLSFLSPCIGLILPFSSYISLSKTKLRDFSYFYLGLITLFVPLTFSGSLVASFLVQYTKYFYYFAATILLIIALNELFKRNCSLNSNEKTPYFSGLAYGFTSIGCTGPILGIIITLTYAKGSALIYPYILSLIFTAGMMVPLILLAIIPLSKKNLLKISSTTIHIGSKKFSLLQIIRISILIISAILIIILGRSDNNLYYIITKQLI